MRVLSKPSGFMTWKLHLGWSKGETRNQKGRTADDRLNVTKTLTEQPKKDAVTLPPAILRVKKIVSRIRSIDVLKIFSKQLWCKLTELT